jgi:hypothetical protein
VANLVGRRSNRGPQDSGVRRLELEVAQLPRLGMIVLSHEAQVHPKFGCESGVHRV